MSLQLGRNFYYNVIDEKIRIFPSGTVSRVHATCRQTRRKIIFGTKKNIIWQKQVAKKISSKSRHLNITDLGRVMPLNR